MHSAYPCCVCQDTMLIKFGTIEVVENELGAKQIRTRVYCPEHTAGTKDPFLLRDSVAA